MIEQEVVEAYNRRLTVDLNNLKKLTPSQRDAVKHHGSLAEALVTNRDLAMFIHQFRFEINDQLASVVGHGPDANSERVALANQLTGIDAFVTMLKSAVYKRNRVLQAEKDGD